MTNDSIPPMIPLLKGTSYSSGGAASTSSGLGKKFNTWLKPRLATTTRPMPSPSSSTNDTTTFVEDLHLRPYSHQSEQLSGIHDISTPTRDHDNVIDAANLPTFPDLPFLPSNLSSSSAGDGTGTAPARAVALRPRLRPRPRPSRRSIGMERILLEINGDT